MPPMNKRIIVGTNFEYTSCGDHSQKYKTGELFSVGKRVAEEEISKHPLMLKEYKRWCFDPHTERVVIMENEVKFHKLYKTKNTSIYYNPDRNVSYIVKQIKQLRGMENSQVCEEKRYCKYGLKLICNKYWILVDKKMPTYLPPIPTDAIVKYR